MENGSGLFPAVGVFVIALAITPLIAGAQQFTRVATVNRLYRKSGDGTFTRVTDEAVATDNDPSSSAAWADHDLDGDLDLFVANVNNYNNALYVNNGNGNAWIDIILTGTTSNRSAIGAKIRLKATSCNSLDLRRPGSPRTDACSE